MRTLGYTGLPMTGLVRLRDHGVTPRYVEELKALGYDGLAEDLILLLDHGPPPNGALHPRRDALPIDMLRRWRAAATCNDPRLPNRRLPHLYHRTVRRSLTLDDLRGFAVNRSLFTPTCSRVPSTSWHSSRPTRFARLPARRI